MRCKWVMFKEERKNSKTKNGHIFIPVTCWWLGVDNSNSQLKRFKVCDE